MQANGCRWHAHCMCTEAAQGGHLPVLKWLAQDMACPMSTLVCTYAVSRGFRHVLYWARAANPPCPWDAHTSGAAARRGDVALLEWMHLKTCTLCTWTAQMAARGGHLETLKWLREKGCTWNESVCNAAAAEGHLTLLVWARTHGCDWWREECREAAVLGAHAEIVEWVDAQPISTRD
jgi:hypothetical protein